ncbi:hypothetical protein Vadar_018372 [Vaccinium darrowii]|uniref:Uncharacterized protein n=1 Tax=Vaccinium darrowii TaxID=229202 RepID=A0ACB7XRI1_9ERIC|nr:hypothetical protein Vadar_018372 [Vaccinium darrowii]
MRSSGNEGEEDGEDEEGETSTYLVSKNPCFLDHRISGLPEESRAEASLLLTSTEELSNDEVFLACALGLCIEWLQAYFIGLEDIMETPRSTMLIESAKGVAIIFQQFSKVLQRKGLLMWICWIYSMSHHWIVQYRTAYYPNKEPVLISAKEEPGLLICPAMDGLLSVHKRIVDVDSDSANAPYNERGRALSVIYQSGIKCTCFCWGNRSRREEDFAKFVKSLDKEMEELVSEREKVKTYDKRKTTLRRFSRCTIVCSLTVE